jgi:hypothetical protein
VTERTEARTFHAAPINAFENTGENGRVAHMVWSYRIFRPGQIVRHSSHCKISHKKNGGQQVAIRQVSGRGIRHESQSVSLERVAGNLHVTTSYRPSISTKNFLSRCSLSYVLVRITTHVHIADFHYAQKTPISFCLPCLLILVKYWGLSVS